VSPWITGGEEGLIRRIRETFPRPSAEVPVPIGDDAACIRLPARATLVITTDQMVEGVHFRRSTHPPAFLGARALTVNLSDLASMGARPRWFLLSLFLPPDVPDPYLEGILTGMAREAHRHRVALVGGNLTAGPALALDITLAGTLPARIRPMLRSGGVPGDRLFVSGTLGGSAFGLDLLASGWRWKRGRAARAGAPSPEVEFATRALRCHLAPSPDYLLASWIARRGLASSAIDLSDGLSLDLGRLCLAAGTGARVDSRRLPLDPAAVAMRGRPRALELALHGGEDYQLLFSVPPGKTPALRRLVAQGRATEIGVLTAHKGRILLEDSRGKMSPIKRKGFDHLRVHPRRRNAN
jgi:thiamine-monophosphate kinase